MGIKQYAHHMKDMKMIGQDREPSPSKYPRKARCQFTLISITACRYEIFFGGINII